MGWTSVWFCFFTLSVASVAEVQASLVRNHVSSICSTWGREHFKTFDGDMYQFPGTCEYNLVSDCHEVYQEFSVHMKRDNNDGIPTVAYVVVTIDDLTFRLTKSQITMNDEPVSVPYFKAGVQVEQNAVYIKLQSKVGITVMWNSEDAVMVEIDNDYANRTCGLCGDFNGVPVYDEFIHEGRQINPIEYGNRQKVHRPNDECEDPYEGDEESPLPGNTQDECKKFYATCSDMLRSESWSSCTSQINPEPYIQACVQDMCGCTDTPSDFCLCSTLAEFSRQCSHAGGDPPHWRKADFCAKQCPYNMVYEESGSPCMDTCSRRDTSSMCEDHKMDGCFCHSGTVFDDISMRGCIPQSQCQCKHDKIYESGEVYKQDREKCTCRGGSWACQSLQAPETCGVEEGSHVTTFDGKTFTFHGDCYYTLAKVESKDGSSPKFTVLAQLMPCTNQEFDTCLKTVKLLLNNNKNNAIIFTSDGIVKQNSQTIILPYHSGDITIFQASSFHILLQTNFGLQIQVQVVPIMQVYIKLDQSYTGKTRGLCGNYNMVLSDDMKTPQGIVEGTATTFTNSWKANLMCSDKEERLEDPCSFSVENEHYAKHWCALLKSQNSTFTSCHSLVDPDIYYKRCIYSSCNCEKSEACLCGVFSSYARACASMGVLLPDWKENVCDKYMKSCPGSQVFSFNHQRCQLTCKSLALKERNCISNFSPVDGCTCAEGSYLDDKGICVPVSKCPCFYNDVYIKPGKSVSIKDEHCVCTNGILHCHSLRLRAATCPSPKVFFNCSSTSSGELGLQCARSCSNLDSDDCDFTECESGCRCPNGLLDDGKGSCVTEEECPCQHEGQIYHPGTKIPNQCNTCICKSGKWLCTRNKCPGSCVFYGSGHYSTFDERTYGFPGHCAYVAVKNNCGNKAVLNSFGVITENVPCGTSSAACSKAIRVQMGDKEIKFSKNKYEEKDLGYGPEITYKIRRVGLYLVLESEIGVGVIWDRKTTVRIVLEPQHSGEVCGLCGNFDGDAQNDFTTQNNLVVNNALEFGNSWKMSSSCPDVTEYENPCDASPNRHHWSKLMCSIILGPTFKDCKKRVDPQPFYESCVKDSCACDSGGDCECFCTAVAAYAQACSEAEACVSWRTPDICPIFCDYYNRPDECQWHYQPCHKACFKTCLNPDGVCTNPLPTLEGCYPICPEDKPFFDENNQTCVAVCPTLPPPTTPPTTTAPPTTTTTTPPTTTTTTPPTTTTTTPPTTTTTTPPTTTTTTPPTTTTTTPPTTTTTTPPTTTTTTPPTTTTTTPPTTTTTTPTTTVSTTCSPECEWSDWYDVHDPTTDHSDWETYENITDSGAHICENRKEIECRSTLFPDKDLDDFLAETHQVVTCDLDYGLICRKEDQKRPPRKCYDYMIRVCCDKCNPTTTAPPTTTTPTPPTTTTTPPTTTTTTPPTTTTTTPPTTTTTTPPTTTTTTPPTTTTTTPPTTTTTTPPTTTTTTPPTTTTTTPPTTTTTTPPTTTTTTPPTTTTTTPPTTTTTTPPTTTTTTPPTTTTTTPPTTTTTTPPTTTTTTPPTTTTTTPPTTTTTTPPTTTTTTPPTTTTTTPPTTTTTTPPTTTTTTPPTTTTTTPPTTTTTTPPTTTTTTPPTTTTTTPPTTTTTTPPTTTTTTPPTTTTTTPPTTTTTTPPTTTTTTPPTTTTTTPPTTTTTTPPTTTTTTPPTTTTTTPPTTTTTTPPTTTTTTPPTTTTTTPPTTTTTTPPTTTTTTPPTTTTTTPPTTTTTTPPTTTTTTPPTTTTTTPPTTTTTTPPTTTTTTPPTTTTTTPPTTTTTTPPTTTTTTPPTTTTTTPPTTTITTPPTTTTTTPPTTTTTTPPTTTTTTPPTTTTTTPTTTTTTTPPTTTTTTPPTTTTTTPPTTTTTTPPTTTTTTPPTTTTTTPPTTTTTTPPTTTTTTPPTTTTTTPPTTTTTTPPTTTTTTPPTTTTTTPPTTTTTTPPTTTTTTPPTTTTTTPPTTTTTTPPTTTTTTPPTTTTTTPPTTTTTTPPTTTTTTPPTTTTTTPPTTTTTTPPTTTTTTPPTTTTTTPPTTTTTTPPTTTTTTPPTTTTTTPPTTTTTTPPTTTTTTPPTTTTTTPPTTTTTTPPTTTTTTPPTTTTTTPPTTTTTTPPTTTTTTPPTTTTTTPPTTTTTTPPTTTTTTPPTTTTTTPPTTTTTTPPTTTITTPPTTTTTTPPTTTTTTPTTPVTPPPPTCPEWNVTQNETFWICKCVLAMCLENYTIVIIPYVCPPPQEITCENGLKPVLVNDEKECCPYYACPCVCEGWGDPHYITFDGLYYSYQGNCTYILMQEKNPKIDLTIYVDNVYCDPTEDVSCPRSLIISYQKEAVALVNHNLLGTPELEVLKNGKSQRLPYFYKGVKIVSTGINLVFEIPIINVTVTFGLAGFRVDIPYELFGNNTQGHCGTCNNDQKDDCMLPGGQTIKDCALMADFWPANDISEEKCPQPTVPPTGNPEPQPSLAPCRPDSLCDLLYSSPFTACHHIISPEKIYKGCVYDSCHMSNPAVECTSLQTYAASCAQAGVCIYWRNHTTLCSSNCPANMVYKPCGPAEPPTCEDNQYEPTMNYTSEGCFCPEGTKLFNKESGICVEKCGCIDPDGIPREVNEKFEYKCQDCICEEATKTVVCKPKLCPKPPVNECKEPGFELVSQTDPSNPCCQVFVCQCKLSNCPITDLDCPVGYKPEVFVPPGKCCPEHRCEPKRVCVYRESEYQPGSSVPGPECQECTCTNEVDPKTGLFLVKCIMKECDRNCQPGYAYIETDPNKCCGKCVQTHCIVTVNGTTTQLLPQGESWSPPHNKCVYYTCIRSNGALITISSNVVCPPFEESECQPGTIQTAANGCCKVCLEKEKGCKKLSMKTHVSHNNCQSAEMVDMTYCEGPCNTYSIYSQAAEGTKYSCACCKELRSSNRTVNLLCLNGETIPHSYMHVEECGCGQTSCTKPGVHERRRRSLTLI